MCSLMKYVTFFAQKHVYVLYVLEMLLIVQVSKHAVWCWSKSIHLLQGSFQRPDKFSQGLFGDKWLTDYIVAYDFL